MGNNNSVGEVIADVGKAVGSVALAVSYFTPAAAITVPLTVGAGVAGGVIKAIGHITDDEAAKKVGGWFGELAVDAAVNGISSGALNGTIASSVAGKKQTLMWIKNGCEVWNELSPKKDMAEAINTGKAPIPTPSATDTIFFLENSEVILKNMF